MRIVDKMIQTHRAKSKQSNNVSSVQMSQSKCACMKTCCWSCTAWCQTLFALTLKLTTTNQTQKMECQCWMAYHHHSITVWQTRGMKWNWLPFDKQWRREKGRMIRLILCLDINWAMLEIIIIRVFGSAKLVFYFFNNLKIINYYKYKNKKQKKFHIVK